MDPTLLLEMVAHISALLPEDGPFATKELASASVSSDGNVGPQPTNVGELYYSFA